MIKFIKPLIRISITELLSIVLLIILLFYSSFEIKQTKNKENLNKLVAIKENIEDLQREVLKTHFFSFKNYDSIAILIKKLKSQEVSLATEVSFNTENIRKKISNFILFIENFKTSNSILKNSESYIQLFFMDFSGKKEEI